MAKNRLTTTEFVQRAQLLHQGTYDYSKTEYLDMRTKIIIRCRQHGEFKQTPVSHLSGSGCRLCGYKRQGYKRRDTRQKFIEKSKKVHRNLYDYSKVQYETAKVDIIIICHKHGEFLQTPNNHLRGQTCPSCAMHIRIHKLTSTTQEFIEKARKKHSDRYDYSEVQYMNVFERINIICPDHGIYKQTPVAHLGGRGCGLCAKTGTSKIEQQWLETFEIVGLEKQKRFMIDKKLYIADGYDSNTDTVYEFFGDFWHGNPDIYDQNDTNPVNKKTFGELYENMQLKVQKYKDYGYNVIYIWEADFYNQMTDE